MYITKNISSRRQSIECQLPKGSIDSFASNTGFMNEFAAKAGALIIYAEHRYYGLVDYFINNYYVQEHLIIRRKINL